MLPSAAGFIDPLLSTGFALNLLGILRLSEAFQASGAVLPTNHVAQYNQDTLSELDATADLISALYAAMDRFQDFSRLSLLYFAALSFTETAWRLGKSSRASGFLLANDPAFSELRARLCEKVRGGARLSASAIHELGPWEVAGLCGQDRRNWQRVELRDLLAHRGRLGVSAEEINAQIEKLGRD